MTTFLHTLARVTGSTATARTENGAVTNATSTDPVVDFFALAGAMRDRPDEAVKLFAAAFQAEPLSALRTLFYLRDVRGGQGERDVFKACLKWLWTHYPAILSKVLGYVPHYGRWDDLLFDGERVPEPVGKMISRQIDVDLLYATRGDSVSLLAKWLPSDKTGSKNPARDRLARNVREALKLSQRDYRKVLTSLRRRIGLLEQKMSGGEWSNIDYGKLPSQAHRRHTAAFYRHDPDGYQAYLDSVVKGEAKINTGTLYPHELYLQRHSPAVDVMWDNLPDYTRPGQDAIVLADVSGSMIGLPMAVSVSLAVYFAERNTGPYQGYFMSFASTPKLTEVKGSTLAERFRSVEDSTLWCGSTNLEAAFTAIGRAGLSTGSVPGTLYVISDMEFDQALNNSDLSVFESAKRDFAEAGLELPHVVFWNVAARNSQVPATIMDGNVTLVSGLSPVVFGMAVEGKGPRELVDSVINGDRYAGIVL